MPCQRQLQEEAPCMGDDMRYTPKEEGGDTPQLHPRQVEVQGWFGEQVRRHTHSRTDDVSRRIRAVEKIPRQGAR